MKHIGKFLMLLTIAFCSITIAFGDECDTLKKQMDEKSDEQTKYRENCCKNLTDQNLYNCACSSNPAQGCSDKNMEYCMNKQLDKEWEELRLKYNDCMNNGIVGVSGPEFAGNWDGSDSFNVLVTFTYHGDSLFLYTQSIDCNRITVAGGSIDHIRKGTNECDVYIKNITSNSVKINVPAGVSQIGSQQSDAGSKTYTRPGTGDGDSENSVCCPIGSTYEYGHCCVGGDCSQVTSECDRIKQLNTECQNIEVNYDNYNYVNGEGTCCFDGGTWEPQCNCSKRPESGECGSGYKLEGVCCVEIPCDELNADEKSKCDQRIRSGEAVIWGENCQCVCDPSKGCCGVQLNTVIPFIGDCIELSNSNNASYSGGKTTINQLNAFPVLMKGLSKIVITLIMIFSIIIVVFAGLMMTTSVANEAYYKKGLEMLGKVAIALILLGTSGLILKLINPTFFGG